MGTGLIPWLSVFQQRHRSLGQTARGPGTRRARGKPEDGGMVGSRQAHHDLLHRKSVHGHKLFYRGRCADCWAPMVAFEILSACLGGGTFFHYSALRRNSTWSCSTPTTAPSNHGKQKEARIRCVRTLTVGIPSTYTSSFRGRRVG